MNTSQTPPGGPRPPLPAHARQLAGRLSTLLDQDIEIVKPVDDAHHRLANASQQLTDTLTATGWSGEQARRANVHQPANRASPQGGGSP